MPSRNKVMSTSLKIVHNLTLIRISAFRQFNGDGRQMSRDASLLHSHTTWSAQILFTLKQSLKTLLPSIPAAISLISHLRRRLCNLIVQVRLTLRNSLGRCKNVQVLIKICPLLNSKE